MNKKRNFCVGEYYHVYNRGVEKRVIFKNTHDHNRFMALLYLCNSCEAVDIGRHFENGGTLNDLFLKPSGKRLVNIVTYCLMPNHFHILIEETSDGGISLFMRKLGTAYSSYFNKKYERTGTLFEGPFKARLVDTEPYLLYLASYIHLNPVKIIEPDWKDRGIKNGKVAEKYLQEYPYSSFFEYTGQARPESAILNQPLLEPAIVHNFYDLIGEWSSKKDLFNNVVLGKESPSRISPL